MDNTERVELPATFEEAHIDHLAILIANMLDRLMAYNDRIPFFPESLTRFHSRSSPSISILDYLRRIIRFTNVEKSCLLLILHYIDRICAQKPLFTLSSLTCHRFVIASITVASKGLCDAFYSNRTYARVGGISVNELNMLEREFLQFIDWRLMCTRDILQEYYTSLVRTHSTGQFVLVEGATATTSSTTTTRGTPSDDGSDSDADMIDVTTNTSNPGTSPLQSLANSPLLPPTTATAETSVPVSAQLRTSWPQEPHHITSTSSSNNNRNSTSSISHNPSIPSPQPHAIQR